MPTPPPACPPCPILTLDRYPAVMPEAGAVYLLHFDQPYKGKRHYLGWASDLRLRLRDHYHGNGNSVPLIKAAHAAGIRMRCIRWWPGDRNLEGLFHYQGPRVRDGKAAIGRHGLITGGSYFCPICCHTRRLANPGQTVRGQRLPAGWTEPRRTP